MVQRIRAYVEELFKDAPATRQAHDLKEEVCSNLIDKYVDLTGDGLSDEEAYNIAVASIGDTDALFAELRRNGQTAEEMKYRRRSALRISIAVGMYILSVVPILMVGESGAEGDEIKALVAMFVICAVATMLLVYNALSKPKYQKLDDTMVEEFREWKQTKKQGDPLYSALSGVLWTLVVIVYFVVSFLFTAWPYSWLIFLVGVALQQIMHAAFLLRKR